MKTCIVTTSYLNTHDYYEKTRKFIKYYLVEQEGLKVDKIYIVDNASNPKKIAEIEKEFAHLPIEFIKFDHFYNRASHLSYPYIWRAIYHIKHLFPLYDKVLYMNNDFYLLSTRIFDYINNLSEGWTCFWCPRHRFPEADGFIVMKDCKEFNDFIASGDFMEHNGKMLERTVPLTNVNKDFNGDRWSEYSNYKGVLPRDADYSAQTRLPAKVVAR